MNKLLLYILALWPFAGWAQGRMMQDYFGTYPTLDSAIVVAGEFLSLSGHQYHYIREEKDNRGIKWLVFEREEKYWDGKPVYAHVAYGMPATPHTTIQDGLIVDYHVTVEYSLGMYSTEFEDMYTIWSKYIDPENADREQLQSNGYVKGPGETRLYAPGVFRVREDKPGCKWDYKFSMYAYHNTHSYSAYSIGGM